jgi:hypothetical protein
MRFVLLFILILGRLDAEANFTWTENCKTAYEYALKLNFKKASEFVEDEKKKNPTNKLTIYIESQIDFLNAFISERKSILDTLKENNSERIDLLKTQPENSPYQKFIIAEMQLQCAVVRIKFEEYFGAVYQIRSAYKLLQENQQEFPQFIPNLKGLGLIHVAVGSIPKTFSWAGNLFGLNGTVREGIDELQTLYFESTKQKEYSFIKEEAIIMLTFLELNLDKRNRDLGKIRNRYQNIETINSKPLMLFSKCFFHTAAAENDSVIYLLSNRKKDPTAFQLYYLDFMEGTARLNNLDFSAVENFEIYSRNYKGNTYKKSVIQREAWIELLKGSTENYIKIISSCKIVKKDENFTDEDKQAINEAKQGIIPNKILLRSRLLFDGGYYNRALKELAGVPISNFPSQRDQIEFTYRLARIFEKLNKREQSIEFYESTLKNGANYSYYFAANSSLLLAQMYENDGNIVKAKEYFKKTLSLRNHEYQNSIDQKAKAGLNRLGE